MVNSNKYLNCKHIKIMNEIYDSTSYLIIYLTIKIIKTDIESQK